MVKILSAIYKKNLYAAKETTLSLNKKTDISHFLGYNKIRSTINISK